MDSGEKLPEKLSAFSQQRRRQKAKRSEQAFVKGPIPLLWLQEAAKLRGKALAVANAVYYRAGLENRNFDLKISGNLLRGFGVNRKARYRALRALETAGLVSVRRQRGASPFVTILDTPGPNQNSE